MMGKVGITTRPDERRREHESTYGHLSNWHVEGPFPSREAARMWEMAHPYYDGSPIGNEPDNIFAKWYGYSFVC